MSSRVQRYSPTSTLRRNLDGKENAGRLDLLRSAKKPTNQNSRGRCVADQAERRSPEPSGRDATVTRLKRSAVGGAILVFVRKPL